MTTREEKTARYFAGIRACGVARPDDIGDLTTADILVIMGEQAARADAAEARVAALEAVVAVLKAVAEAARAARRRGRGSSATFLSPATWAALDEALAALDGQQGGGFVPDVDDMDIPAVPRQRNRAYPIQRHSDGQQGGA